MDNELNMLHKFAASKEKLPRKEFVKLYRKIIRMGSSEEANEAHKLIKSLESTPSLIRFSHNADLLYKKLMTSRIGYEWICEILKDFKGTDVEINRISENYNRIEDTYFLKKANELISNVSLLQDYINIRRIEKEVNEEKELIDDEINEFLVFYEDVFAEYNAYLSNEYFNEERFGTLLDNFEKLKAMAENYWALFGSDRYHRIYIEIDNAIKELNTYKSSR